MDLHVIASIPRAWPRRRRRLTRFTYAEYHMGVDARLWCTRRTAGGRSGLQRRFRADPALDSMPERLPGEQRDAPLRPVLAARRCGSPRTCFRVLQRAQAVSRYSNGGVRLHRRPPGRAVAPGAETGVLPDPAPSSVPGAGRLRKLRLDARARTPGCTVPGTVKLDLGGIAKGYADTKPSACCGSTASPAPWWRWAATSWSAATARHGRLDHPRPKRGQRSRPRRPPLCSPRHLDLRRHGAVRGHRRPPLTRTSSTRAPARRSRIACRSP